MVSSAFKTLALSLALVAASPALADGGLSFIINGDTFSQPFSITNTSTGGEYVIGFGLDLSSTGTGFDTVDGGPPTGHANGAVQFAAVGSTGTNTGLVSSPVVPDGATSFGLTFTNFGVGKTFSWDIDVDHFPSSGDNATVYGNELIGATAYVDFSNGLRATGILAAVNGQPRASAFSVRSVAPTPQVPEPATWAMMVGGFGLVGAALRRKKVAVRFG